MIIESITLHDFRSFRGEHEFDLAPRVKYGVQRPIILFGGLNGSGKTSILTAIKLALYGRHGLGLDTSKSAYESLIKESIHSPPTAKVKPESAWVSIKFIYGKLGRSARYEVRRDWKHDGRKLKETLRIFEDGQLISSLSHDEAQGFLNELIPVGVSELFFFDGEKIAELAEDDSGGALGDAIRKLLGLDLVERLRTDLKVYSLRYGKQSAGRSSRSHIETLERSHEEQRHIIKSQKDALDAKINELREKERARESVEEALAQSGGVWGKSREDAKLRARELSDRLRKIQADLRAEVAGIYPLTLCGGVLDEALLSLEESLEGSRRDAIGEAIRAFADDLKREISTLSAHDQAIIDELVSRSAEKGTSTPPLIDIGAKELARLDTALKQLGAASQARIQELSVDSSQISNELDEIALRIERAPDAEALRAELDRYTALCDEIATLKSEIQFGYNELKGLYLRSIDIVRDLKSAYEGLTISKELERPLEYATKARALLKEFGEINAARRVEQLEREFTDAFRRLARKGDLALSASIDPIRFTVTLTNGDGVEVNKSQLSAGEKQIYAIAMLEGLARTAGRRLPIIIDTPLGRLDSKHRANLVEHYFPRASHQVVLLSTDTEIDQSFYSALSRHISHAIHLEYDENERTSSSKEGYFWRAQLKAVV